VRLRGVPGGRGAGPLCFLMEVCFPGMKRVIRRLILFGHEGFPSQKRAGGVEPAPRRWWCRVFSCELHPQKKAAVGVGGGQRLSPDVAMPFSRGSDSLLPRSVLGKGGN